VNHRSKTVRIGAKTIRKSEGDPMGKDTWRVILIANAEEADRPGKNKGREPTGGKGGQKRQISFCNFDIACERRGGVGRIAKKNV